MVLSYVVPALEWALSRTIGKPFEQLSPQAKLLVIVGLLDFAWLFFGTMFYYLMPNYLIGDLTFTKSFYFAANVGLGIGFDNVTVHHSQVWPQAQLATIARGGLPGRGRLCLQKSIVKLATRTRHNARLHRLRSSRASSCSWALRSWSAA